MTLARSFAPARGLALGVAIWLAVAPVAAAAPRAGGGAAAEQAGDAARTPPHEGLGTIRGVLYGDDEITRLAGATVTAINVRTGRRYVSNHTGANGAYEVTDLPAGTYDIAIDSARRVYVTDGLVDLAENQRLYLSFAVRASVAAEAGSPDAAGAARMTFTDPNAIPQASSARGKKGFWKRPGGIAIISILVAGTAAAAVSAQQSD